MSKPEKGDAYVIKPYGDKLQVIERESGLIMRTLNTRGEAERWIKDVEK